MTIRGDGFSVPAGGAVVQGAGTGVTLDQGADVTNSGTWQLNWHGGIQGGGTPFTNTASGTVHKTGPNQADINVPFTNNGAIDVDGGALGLQTPVSLAPTTYQVAEGARLNIGSVNGVTQWHRVQDVTGGGVVAVSGELDSFGVQWAFGPGEAEVSGTVDTNPGAFTVTGTADDLPNRLTIRSERVLGPRRRCRGQGRRSAGQPRPGRRRDQLGHLAAQLARRDPRHGQRPCGDVHQHGVGDDPQDGTEPGRHQRPAHQQRNRPRRRRGVWRSPTLPSSRAPR